MKAELYSIIDRFVDISEDSDLGKENANFIRSLPVMENLI